MYGLIRSCFPGVSVWSIAALANGDADRGMIAGGCAKRLYGRLSGKAVGVFARDVRSGGSDEAEKRALAGPVERQVSRQLQQTLDAESDRLPPGQDRIDDVRREIGQPHK